MERSLAADAGKDGLVAACRHRLGSRVGDAARMPWRDFSTIAQLEEGTRNAGRGGQVLHHRAPPGFEDVRVGPDTPEIGIGASLTARPLPHHRAYGSVHGDSAG